MCWSGIGERAETKIDTRQGEVRLIKERGKSQVETEDRHRGERNVEGIGQGFIEGFL